MDTTNPLLSLHDLADFDAIRPEHVEPAMRALLEIAQSALETAVDATTPVDYDAMAAVLDVATERLGRAWSAVGHLNSVADTPDLRAAYNAQLGAVTAFYTRLAADERLFSRYKALHERSASMPAARRQALAHAVRDFVLSGAELQGAARERHAQIRARRAELSQKFSENVLDATDGYTLDLPESRLEGLPADARAAAREAAQQAGVDAWRLTLHAPSYLPAMQHLRDRAAREALYRGYVTRASEHGPAERDNAPLIAEILGLRQEEARLLGLECVVV